MNNKKIFIIAGFLALFLVVVVFILFPSRKSVSNKTPPVSVTKLIPEKQIEQKQRLEQSLEQSPSQLFGLTNWKLTLPITDPNDPKEPLEIRQPELNTFQLSPWFKLTPNNEGIVFRAPVNAPTTVNSSYPRSELREMTADGEEEIFWSSTEGTHTFFFEEAITAVPKNKQDVVTGQIHGDDGDLLVIRLEGQKLFLARSSADLATLDDNYVLGRRFSIKFVASGGEIAVYYNKGVTPVYTLQKKVNEAYFKVGIYTQSNCETEESPELCSEDNYGEAVIYKIEVTHK